MSSNCSDGACPMGSNGHELICTLPSSETACRIASGDPTALPLLFRDLVLRGFLVASGIAVVALATGEKSPRKIIGYGMAGAAGIEMFVIGYSCWINREK